MTENLFYAKSKNIIYSLIGNWLCDICLFLWQHFPKKIRMRETFIFCTYQKMTLKTARKVQKLQHLYMQSPIGYPFQTIETFPLFLSKKRKVITIQKLLGQQNQSKYYYNKIFSMPQVSEIESVILYEVYNKHTCITHLSII